MTGADKKLVPLAKRLPQVINCNDQQKPFVEARLRDVAHYARIPYEWLKDDGQFRSDAKAFVQSNQLVIDVLI